jgi:hypothetical protein
MTLLHVRLFGDKTVINLPAAFRKGRITLRGYRVLFNRDNHGYHHMSVRSTLLGRANIAAFTAQGNPDGYAAELPIWLDPEAKLSEDKSITWPLGRVENPGSAIVFEMALYNCIERKRYDQATFPETTLDPNIRTLKGLSPQQPYFGQFGESVPLYLFPRSYKPDQSLDADADTNGIGDSFEEINIYNAKGVKLNSAPAATAIYPSTRWVHTGVQVGDVDPTPGGRDYTEHRTTAEEVEMYNNSDFEITGSGFRTNAIIYPYTIELVFELEDGA